MCLNCLLNEGDGYDDFDSLFLLAKGINGHNSKQYLWGPEADLMAKTLIASWNKASKAPLKKIMAAFDWDGDGSVNMKKLKVALASSEKIGDAMWKSHGKKAKTVNKATQDRAQIHFNKQRKEVKKEVDWAGVTLLADNQLQDYIEDYPERVMHPEIMRLADITQQNPASRTMDKAVMQARLSQMAAKGKSYFTALSDVQIGKSWSVTGLQLAVGEGVSEYVIHAEFDRKTCPVCKRLHGKTFSVSAGYRKAVASFTTIAKGSNTFPRLPQIDNVSPKQIRKLNLSPPFHPKCRCDLHFLW